MIRGPLLIWSGLLILLVNIYVTSKAAASGYHYKDSLKLIAGDQPHLLMEFEMPERLYEKIRSSRGKDMDLEDTKLRFNGDTVSINDAHLHGQTTLYYERKSFSVDTKKKIKLCKECDGLGAFYLVSLSMDRNYFHNRLSFDLLHELDLFHLQYTYTELKINGHSQGIYLVLQRPQDWALKEIGSPYIVRRGGGDRLIDRERFGKGASKELKKFYREQFISIYRMINLYSGEELHEKLNEVMDLQDYMRWLAFNFIIKCGDYSDELYFYSDPGSKRLKIVPWDYDDIFMTHPHEGIEERNKKMEATALIFSSEDKLDVKIANDPYLYEKYTQHLASVLNELSSEKIQRVLLDIYSDLSPLYGSKEILEAVSKDGYQTSPKILRDELHNVYNFFEGQRLGLLKKNASR